LGDFLNSKIGIERPEKVIAELNVAVNHAEFE